MYEENNAGVRGVGFGQTIHAGVTRCVGFGLKNPRAGSGRVVIFRPIENSNPKRYLLYWQTEDQLMIEENTNYIQTFIKTVQPKINWKRNKDICSHEFIK